VQIDFTYKIKYLTYSSYLQWVTLSRALCGVHPVLQGFADYVGQCSVVFGGFGLEKGDQGQGQPDGDLPSIFGDVVMWCFGQHAYMRRYAVNVNRRIGDWPFVHGRNAARDGARNAVGCVFRRRVCPIPFL
jgi:hypothetical protein